MFRYRKSVVLFGVACLALSGCGSTVVPGNTTNTITVQSEADTINVSGSSTKKVAPDVARITFSVTSEYETAEESQRKNTEDTNAVIATLKEAGVPDNKIKTYNYQMYPRYDYLYDYETGRDGERVLQGYVVTNTLEVSGLEVDAVGDIITACVQAGINDIDGIDYTCSNYDELYNEALADAIEVARVKAQAIAESSGVKVGSVKKVIEGWQDTSYRYTNNAAMVDEAYNDAGAVAFDAMPGELEIVANVDVNFEIEQ